MEKVSATSCTACGRETDSSTNTSGMCEHMPGQQGGGHRGDGYKSSGWRQCLSTQGEFRPPLTHSVTQSLTAPQHITCERASNCTPVCRRGWPKYIRGSFSTRASLSFSL